MSRVDPGIAGLNHLCLSVPDLDAALVFYDRLMPAMGWRERGSADSRAYVAGNYEIYLQQSRIEGAGFVRHGVGLQHLAFNAPSRQAVDALHALLLEIGARVTDAPAEYPHYSDGYYAVFFQDPGGIALEFCHTPNMSL
ncbi:VOC family protein [Chromobacterium violaceum]|uniref:VOC family protein n=1 Tax=Chromobacterium violaceum TaxID=536 RepID=UPI0035A61E85